MSVIENGQIPLYPNNPQTRKAAKTSVAGSGVQVKNSPLYGLTQKTAQSSTVEKAEVAKRNDAVTAFLDYMNKTPEERLYESILREMGLTKEELERLPPDKREKVEKKIEAKMKQKAEETVAKSLLGE